MSGGCCTEANNLKGSTSQSVSGWTFSGVSHGPWNYESYNQCSAANNVCWFGWGGGDGTISTILHGNGRALLKFGNCHNENLVKAFKNDVEIGRLEGHTTAQIEIEFQDGDVIKISEHTAVVQFNDLSIVECFTDTPTLPTTTTTTTTTTIPISSSGKLHIS